MSRCAIDTCTVLAAHDGLRCEVRGPGYDEVILAQLLYEHENDAQ